MEILAKLFGGTARVKLLRLFLFNPEIVFESKELTARTKLTTPTIRRELSIFKHIGLIRSKGEIRTVGSKKKKINGWQLDQSFTFGQPLRELLSAELFPDNHTLVKRFNGCGKIQIIAVAGVFLRDPQSYVDLVIVGELLNRAAIEQIIRALEAEVGKELTYAILDTDDFLYRYHSSDKFIRDLLDHPHEFLVDKLDIA